MELKQRRVIINWDGYHGPEQYILPYNEALALLPMLLKYVPSATLYDYEHYAIHGDTLPCRRCFNPTENEQANAATTFPGEPNAGPPW